MTVRICHFSDTHGFFSPLPEADIYVATGDMLDNYPKFSRIELMDCKRGVPFGPMGDVRIIEPDRERDLQEAWFKKKFASKGDTFRKFFPNECRDNPVVVVRGNHDFTDLAPMFGGDVFEIGLDPKVTRTVGGLVFGGFRGVPFIQGEWCDELQQSHLSEMARELPKEIDVLCTHTPPWGILDGWMGEQYGAHGLAEEFNRKVYSDAKLLKAHLFGHVHSDFGTKEIAGTIFSNAAQSRNVIELEV